MYSTQEGIIVLHSYTKVPGTVYIKLLKKTTKNIYNYTVPSCFMCVYLYASPPCSLSLSFHCVHCSIIKSPTICDAFHRSLHVQQ